MRFTKAKPDSAKIDYYVMVSSHKIWKDGFIGTKLYVVHFPLLTRAETCRGCSGTHWGTSRRCRVHFPMSQCAGTKQARGFCSTLCPPTPPPRQCYIRSDASGWTIRGHAGTRGYTTNWYCIHAQKNCIVAFVYISEST